MLNDKNLSDLGITNKNLKPNMGHYTRIPIVFSNIGYLSKRCCGYYTQICAYRDIFYLARHHAYHPPLVVEPINFLTPLPVLDPINFRTSPSSQSSCRAI